MVRVHRYSCQRFDRQSRPRAARNEPVQYGEKKKKANVVLAPLAETRFSRWASPPPPGRTQRSTRDVSLEIESGSMLWKPSVVIAARSPRLWRAQVLGAVSHGLIHFIAGPCAERGCSVGTAIRFNSVSVTGDCAESSPPCRWLPATRAVQQRQIAANPRPKSTDRGKLETELPSGRFTYQSWNVCGC